ncbi:3-ketoacyl-CoA thiolase 2, peroxisomal [gamma proteobacterium HTCC5015]|nr:3-ketoacyl-CoA thiolase 2, peroxisomal [gamma proteobacterium HTCC5015]
MSQQMQDAYIVKAVRTPVAKARGAFKHVRPDDMLAHVLKGVTEQNSELRERVEDVIVGCAMPEAEQGMNVARIGVLLAGFPDSVPAVTINRFCSSGSQAVAMAADKVRLGEADVMIAAGTESMTMVPMMGNKIAMNSRVFQDENVGIAYGMGITAEKVAERWNVSRQAQDEFATESHRRAIQATENGWFADEILPYDTESTYQVPGALELSTINKTVSVDEGPRPGTTPESLAKLRTVFRADGSVTAGNASQMSDGAGAVLIVSEKILKEYNLEPIGRFVTSAVAGVPADIMGIGPKEAIPMCLKRAGLKQDDLDWVELNEAFAAQALAVMGDLDLNPEKVNPNGGAIALGHPLGATGAIRTATMFNGLERTNGKYGMVTMCIGTGMGFAMICEKL